jgi:hypothetical protein
VRFVGENGVDSDALVRGYTKNALTGRILFKIECAVHHRLLQVLGYEEGYIMRDGK